MLSDDLKARFIAITGERNALVSAHDIAPHLVEWRGLYHGVSDLVLKPSTTEEVSAILRLASETKTPIVPQGGNTGLVGGQIPDQSGDAIVLSLSLMNKIRELDMSARAIIAEAGTVLADIQTKADETDLLFPLSLASEGSCQIGGNLSSNAGGTGALAYGVARDLCLGLELVLPSGQIINGLNTLKKDNRGYDLKNLFIGAEGTLGVITAASLKLFPKPKGCAVAWIGLKSPENALQLYRNMSARLGPSLTAFELCGTTPMAFALKHGGKARPVLQSDHDWYVLAEVSSLHDQSQAEAGLTDALSVALGDDLVDDAAMANSLQQFHDFWHLREAMSESQKPEGCSIKHDISLPIAAIPDFIAQGHAVVQNIVKGARVVCFGHMGDGNLHYNISQPLGADAKAFVDQWKTMNEAVHGLVAKFDGSFSAEHGIGQLKRDILARNHDEGALQAMRAIKATFDPLGIMNPGKIL